MPIAILQITLVAFISFIFIKLLIKYPISLATPSKRGMHCNVMPSSGGIAILGTYICITLYPYLIHAHSLNINSPIIGLTLIALLGYLDDKFKLSKAFRFFSQAIISILVIVNSHQLNILEIIIWACFFIFLVNIYNFMDGIDGLATSQAIFVLTSFIILDNFYSFGVLILFIIPLLIFLFYNIKPSKVFLGNAGSYMLGMLIIILLFNSTYASDDIYILNHIAVALILLTIFIADSLYVLLARFIYKYKSSNNILLSLLHITTPHNTHCYQILAKKYNNHNKVNLLLMLYNILWCLPLSILCQTYIEYSIVFLLFSYIPYLFYCYNNNIGKE
tara:strand:+ start:50 stop:1048 length:999 start_codon:yes stop_codon:yes gene_type:complete